MKLVRNFLLFFVVLAGVFIFFQPTSASAENRYWVGGTGNWSDTTHWSTTSGGSTGASVPTVSDDAFLDGNSGGGTLSVSATAAVVNNLDFTGYTGALSGSGNLNISGNLTLGSGMTMTNFFGNFNFNATSGVKTITTNGKAIGGFGNVVFNGVGGTWQLQDTFTITNTQNTSLTLTNGTFDANGKTVVLSGTNHTITGNFTFFNLTRTGTATKVDTLTLAGNQTITGTLTLTGNSITNRLWVLSSVEGTTRTLTAAAVSLTNVDFMDVTGAGAASPFTGASLGDELGNSGITFDTPTTRYAVAAGNWSASSTWSTSSGGAAGTGIPLPQDDVVLNASSGVITVNVDTRDLGKSLTTTGFTGTLALTGNINAGFGVYGDFTLVSGMTFTSNTRKITLRGRGTHTITSAGKSHGQIGVSAPGGTYTLQDTLTITNGGIVFTSGALDFNGKTISMGSLSATGTATSTLTMGASVITSTGWTLASNVTLSAGTSQLTVNGSTFDGGGKTYNNVSGSLPTMSGANTFSNLTLSSGLILSADQIVTSTFTVSSTFDTTRPTVKSSAGGTSRTITAAAVSLNKVNFQDIIGAGAATWSSATALGDMGGNTNITFQPAVSRYAVASGNWAASSTWSTSSGGSAGASVPLPQDSVFIDGNSGTGTITNNATILGKNIDFTGYTGTFAFTSSGSIFGSLTFSASTTVSGNGGPAFSGRGSNTITMAGKSFGTGGVTVDSGSGSYTLQDALTTTGDFTFTSGTFSANNQNVTARSFLSTGAIVRTLNMGAGTWELTGTSFVWSTLNGSNLTTNANSSTLKISNATATFKTLFATGTTFNNLWFTGSGTGALQIAGNNTFNDFKVDTAPKTITFTGETATTVSTFTVSGTAGNLITLQSGTAGLPWAITKSGGGTISSDYLSVRDSTATPGSTWNAGANSTNVSNNSGWSFGGVSNTAPTATIGTPAQASSSTVSFTATFSDADSNVTSATVQYSTDNSTWSSASLGSVTASQGTVATSTGSITSIDTDAAATVTLTIIWRAGTDLANTEDSTVFLRIIPSDGTDTGSTQTSSAFALDTLAQSTPTNFTVENGTITSANFAWSEVGGASSYNIYQGDTLTGTFTRIGSNPTVSSASTTSYTATGLSTGSRYYWKITSLDTAGNESARSEANSLVVGAAGSSSGGGGSSGGSASVPSAPAPSTSAPESTTPSASEPAATTVPANFASLPIAEQITVLENIIDALIAQLVSEGIVLPPTVSAPAPITQTLIVGVAAAPQVSSLQTYLVVHGFLQMPPGVSKGYFGPITKQAVIELQISAGIIKSANSPGAGIVGPKTRAYISSH